MHKKKNEWAPTFTEKENAKSAFNLAGGIASKPSHPEPLKAARACRKKIRIIEHPGARCECSFLVYSSLR